MKTAPPGKRMPFICGKVHPTTSWVEHKKWEIGKDEWKSSEDGKAKKIWLKSTS